MAAEKGKIFVADKDGVVVLKLVGDIRLVLCASIDEYIDSIFSTTSVQIVKAVIVDTREAMAIDSTSLGILAKLSLFSTEKYSLKTEIICCDASIKKLLISVGFDQIASIVMTDENQHDIALRELDCEEDLDEDNLRKTVVNSHKILMELNDKNKQEFKELVDALEKPKQ